MRIGVKSAFRAFRVRFNPVRGARASRTLGIDGNLDEIRVWTRALADVEIAALVPGTVVNEPPTVSAGPDVAGHRDRHGGERRRRELAVRSQKPTPSCQWPMSQPPNQKRKGERARTEGKGSPDPGSRKAPPHDQAGCDPNQEGDANDIHQDGPHEVQKQRMMVTAPKVHSQDNLIPSQRLPLGPQFLFVDQKRQPRLIEEGPAGDPQLRRIRSLHVECSLQIVVLQNLVRDHPKIAILGNGMTILTLE